MTSFFDDVIDGSIFVYILMLAIVFFMMLNHKIGLLSQSGYIASQKCLVRSFKVN